MTAKALLQLAGILGILALTGCAVRSSPPTQLFVLAASAAMGNDAVSAKGPGLGPERVPELVVGPIELPAYTERSQVLTLHGQSQLQAAVTARWAEPLDKNFSRVLVENLSRLLGSGEVTTLGSVQAKATLQVTAEVTEFVATEAGKARLTAYWRVLGEGGRKVLASDKAHYQEDAEGADYPALVAAMSRTVAALSRDIAQAVRDVARGRKALDF